MGIFMRAIPIFFLLITLCLIGCEPTAPAIPDTKSTKTYDIEDESPEAGGPGFTGKDWDNFSENPPEFSDPNAQKGGTIRMGINTFPVTIRFLGKDSNYVLNSMIRDLLYESLLKLHPNTLEYLPSLATHWQILRDNKTFRFRLNPQARWADGRPVTTDDVIASWQFHIDESLESLYITKLYQKFKKPVAESKYIFHITATELNWRLFMNFAVDMTIYPAHILSKLTGATYLQEYENQVMVGSGPYEMPLEMLERGKKIVLLRRANYWGMEEKYNRGLYNFDRIELLVEPDVKKSFEQFQNYELDIYVVNEAARWVNDTNFPNIQRGLIQKRKIYNKCPQGFNGIAFNMRRAPLNDVRVRNALVLLFNREKLIEQYFYKEYAALDSYFAGSVYANPSGPKYRYDFEKAVKLLGEAGWKHKTKDGILVKDRKLLQLTLVCSPSLSKRGIFKTYQEDLKKAGIQLQIQGVDPQEQAKLLRKFQFDMFFVAWSGSPFPDPEDSWESSLANKEDSNNICGVKLETVDKVCRNYSRMFIQRQRVAALQELDKILMKHHPYALGWGSDAHRILFWNKFKYPPGCISKTGRHYDALWMWYTDFENARKVEQAIAETGISFTAGEVEDKYWLK